MERWRKEGLRRDLLYSRHPERLAQNTAEVEPRREEDGREGQCRRILGS